MVKGKYDTIICDLGNVLVNFDHRIAARKLLEYTPRQEEDIYNLFFDSPITSLYEEGKIYTDEFFRRVKDFLMLEMEKDDFMPIWNDIFFESPLNIKMQNFLKKIKTKFRLVMLSNINKAHFEFLEKRMDIFKDFDKLVLSYEVGFRKPAPEIYNIALLSVKTTPSRAFYIDDRQDLVKSASRIGINGIVFDGGCSFKTMVEAITCRDT